MISDQFGSASHPGFRLRLLHMGTYGPPQLSHFSRMMSSNRPMQAKTVLNVSQLSARTTHISIGRLRATHPNTSGPRQQQHAPAVRRIVPSDKQAWLSLFKEYIAWYKASVPDDVIELTWQRIMAGGEGNHQGFVAEDETGQVIGLAHFLLHRSTWSSTHYCYLEDLYVHHEVRGGGVGKALIEAVYHSADQQQATKTYWQTHEFNYRARGLYDKMGHKSAFMLYERD